MRILLCKLSAGALLLVAVASANAAIEVRLKEQVEITTSRYTLQDVAELKGKDMRAVQSVGSVVVGKAPRSGYLTQLSRHAIRATLRRRNPGLAQELNWRGADVVKVRAIGVELDIAEVREKAREALFDRLDGEFEKFEIRPEYEIDPVRIPQGEVTIEARKQRLGGVASRMRIWCDVYVDGDHYQSVSVWFRVSAYDYVAKLEREVAEKSPFTTADLEWVYQDVAGAGPVIVRRKFPVYPVRLKRALGAGSLVRAGDVEALPTVAKGQVVKVHVSEGSVSLVAKAVALNDAWEDERIKLSTLDGLAAYSATVIGKGEVRVHD